MLALVASSVTASAGPKAVIQPTGALDQDPNHCGFRGDSLTLSIVDEGKKLVHRNYCSAYGKGAAEVFTDRNGRIYVILEHAEGHGTNATTEYVTIYRLIAANLDEIIRVPVSWGTGPTSRATYSYRAEDVESGGLKLTMWRTDNGGEECCVLPEKTQVIMIDAR